MVETATITLLLVTLSLFFAAAIAEIGGGYFVWLWIRKKKRLILGLAGALVLFVYGIIPTMQPGNCGRVYAAYGGIFVVSSIL
jgi:small multidrug resistance family-3 protein